jgi:phage shock protein C|tara:strand:- start:694 stop:885 length:192 start_codon:yes stop_codon:yes gene_type:complete
MSSISRDKKQGMIFGVCAGIAKHLGINTALLRVGFVLAAIFSGSLFFWLYLLLGIFLPVQDEE